MKQSNRTILLVVAAQAEARALLVAGAEVEFPAWTLIPGGPGVEVLLAGVGKANASGAVARLLEPTRHAAVVSIGIAGALPEGGASIGDVVIASASIFADEGVLTSQGFEDLSHRGFPPWGGAGIAIPADADLVAWMTASLAGLEPRVHAGPIATVSTCSGTDELAAEIRSRTGAIAEAMEGAGVGASAGRLGVAFGEVRVISNTTGDRDCQVWEMARSLRILGQVGRRLSLAGSALPGVDR